MSKQAVACAMAAAMVVAWGVLAGAASGQQAMGRAVGAGGAVGVPTEGVGLGVLPVGACCVPGGCVVTTAPECLVLGGVYRGDGVACEVPPQYRLRVQPGGLLDLTDVPVTNLLPSVTPNRDDGAVAVPIGFTFPFFGAPRNTVFVSSNGFVTFGAPSTAFENDPVLPTPAAPNEAIYGYWTDLDLRVTGQLRAAVVGPPVEGPRLVIEWRNAPRFGLADSNTFQIVLYPDGVIEVRYGVVTPAGLSGATVGVENAGGVEAYQAEPGMVAGGGRVLRMVPVPGHPACPPGPVCGTGGSAIFDQIDPAGQTGQALSQSTNCPGCLLSSGSFACMDDFEINGLLGIGGLPGTTLTRVEAVVRDTGMLPVGPQWRVNIYSSLGAGFESPVGNVYSETFAAPSCVTRFFDDARYPGFDLVSFDLGTGLFNSGTRSLGPGVYALSVVAVTNGPAPDVLVALSGNDAGPTGEANAARVQYFPPPSAVVALGQNAGYRIYAGDGTGCAVDFNGDGNVDPDDLSDYIGCYFTPP
ncbi:MAG: hypothetical protein JNK35_06815, partial [Phycisphaerae bacterium]|nr:hypothetical protein [Phycisphaerae bacterium]